MNGKPSAVAVGMFDGVHIGHRALLAHANNLAKENGFQSVAYTFINHPRSVFATAPDMLMTANERRLSIENIGIDLVCMEEFTNETARLSPNEFIRALTKRFDVRVMIAGFNYTFGHNGCGTVETLYALGAEHGFDVVIEPHVDFFSEPVSSSRIRACILSGDIQKANIMLGKPYSLSGYVIRNKNIGTQLGFPTANIDPPLDKALPRPGVYATSVMIGGQTISSVTNIGNNPTVSGDKTSVETHIFDYSGDLYGKPLTIFFHEYLREERRFNTKEELKQQIESDATRARLKKG